jgi:glycosyltransferase involved in cell wall biosynthesis
MPRGERIGVERDGHETILFMVASMSEGGVQKAALDWFRHVDGARFRKLLVTTRPCTHPWMTLLGEHADGIFDAALPAPDPEAVRHNVLELIRRERPSIVHISHSLYGYEMLEAIKQVPDPPKVVAQFHNFEYRPDGSRGGYPHWVPARFDRFIDAYSVVSDELAREVELILEREVAPRAKRRAPGSAAAPRSKVHRIYLGVDLDEFVPGAPMAAEIAERRRPGRMNVLWIGRMTPQKNPGMLLDVVQAGGEIRETLHFHIIGDGPDRASFESRLHRSGLSGCCSLYPFQRRVRDWYEMADVLLLTSRFEGLPLVLYEAMAMGLPSVAPDVGGISELLTPGTGLLLRAQPTPEEYDEAIRSLESETVRNKTGALARKRVADFSVTEMARRHERLYSELLGKTGANSDGEPV